MLTSTFCHIKGISVSAEQMLWDRGIITWNDFLRNPKPVFSPAKDKKIKEALDLSKKALKNRSADFFLSRLPREQQIRIYPHFHDVMRFVDVETTGLNLHKDHLTMIAVYDGKKLRQYIKGINLWNFVWNLRPGDIWVTYNGDRFDLPFIRKTFKIQMPCLHIDLMPVLSRLGWRGGLKKIAAKMNLKRETDEMNGEQAALMWKRYIKNNDPELLESLKKYNVEDAVIMTDIMVKAYNRSMSFCPVQQKLKRRPANDDV